MLVRIFVWCGVGYTSGVIIVATLIAFYRLGESQGDDAIAERLSLSSLTDPRPT